MGKEKKTFPAKFTFCYVNRRIQTFQIHLKHIHTHTNTNVKKRMMATDISMYMIVSVGMSKWKYMESFSVHLTYLCIVIVSHFQGGGLG